MKRRLLFELLILHLYLMQQKRLLRSRLFFWCIIRIMHHAQGDSSRRKRRKFRKDCRGLKWNVVVNDVAQLRFRKPLWRRLDFFAVAPRWQCVLPLARFIKPAQNAIDSLLQGLEFVIYPTRRPSHIQSKGIESLSSGPIAVDFCRERIELIEEGISLAFRNLSSFSFSRIFSINVWIADLAAASSMTMVLAPVFMRRAASIMIF
jgi:hypothetical protein